ncbi:arylsulfatase A-like enzyme [Aliiruegeria haliotis]|uniref:Arylsulfatase A-like enzyme n=1 Tax=Aliiruegeria haliotis TaxID=1280846 RepID=A0A2T0RFP3_9RHOB|nr:sulfatase [Aliiruegeria haliotis]PRY19941.1 arylsulfatase A-like enzyme [Aliiruegeria haliotis]
MRTVFVLFDSLNRLALQCYGGTAVATPNFDRFAARSARFSKHYVGSMPCMPARRDMHTGRLNFMHRSWGPLEPYDNSFSEMLRAKGVYTHLITDHLHYMEDGGSGFHTRFSSYEFHRGQEYDPWKPLVEPPMDHIRETFSEKHYDFERAPKRLNYAINRQFIKTEEDFPAVKCFNSAFEFLDLNRGSEDWMMMLECFDPHEPFFAPERFHTEETRYTGKILDWPHYDKVVESDAEIDAIRANYCALVAMCDHYFGKLLDYFDEHDMWKDTALVLTTDHGFLLGEQDWWGKCRMPYFEEISHIPLMIHDPRHPEPGGRKVDALTQSTDLMPTLLGLHGIAPPPEARSIDLARVANGNAACGRASAIFGIFGGAIGVTDGTHVMYLYPDDVERDGLREHTLVPAHMTEYFTAEELATAELVPPFDFTKGVPLVSYAALKDAKRVPMNDGKGFGDIGTRLYDLVADPGQKNPIKDELVTAQLRHFIEQTLADHDTPQSVYDWYGLSMPKRTTHGRSAYA